MQSLGSADKRADPVAGLDTPPDRRTYRRLKAGKVARAILFLLMTAVLILAVLGVFGPKSGDATASGAGYDLTASFQKTSRGGLPARFSLEIHRQGGFSGPVVVASSSDYFDIFDQNGLDPQPTSETTKGDEIVWTFDPPDGDTLKIDLDARVEPGLPAMTKHGHSSILENGQAVATVDYSTRIYP